MNAQINTILDPKIIILSEKIREWNVRKNIMFELKFHHYNQNFKSKQTV